MGDRTMTNRTHAAVADFEDAGKVLPSGLRLGDYEICSCLFRGPDIIAYLAKVRDSQQSVVVREFFPLPHVEREVGGYRVVPVAKGNEARLNQRREAFLTTARALSTMQHEDVQKVSRAFAAFNTVYSVSPHVDSPALAETAPAPNSMTQAWLSPVLCRLLQGLAALHEKGICHCNLTPDSILLRADGSPYIDGVSDCRESPLQYAEDALPVYSYSPLELLQTGLSCGPWSDVYSLGAICYRLITGEYAPNSIYRSYDAVEYKPLAGRKELHLRFTPAFLATIDRAMAVQPEHRWQSTQDWLTALRGKPACRRKSRGWRWLTGAALVAAIAGYCLLPSGVETLSAPIPVAHVVSAAEQGDCLTLQQFIDDGGDVNATDAAGNTPLSQAVYNGNVGCVELLLANTAIDVNRADEYGYTPLFWAVYKKRTDCLRKLLAYPGTDVNRADAEGYSPLFWAVRCGYTEGVELLLAAGADVNHSGSDGCAALHEAAACGDCACMQLLLNANEVDVNLPDVNGVTPLAVAAHAGRGDCVRMLLACPAIDAGFIDNFGRTPLNMAEGEECAEAAELLRDMQEN